MILEERHVSDVVVAILDSPMSADGVGSLGGRERRLDGVVGDFLRRFPGAGSGVLAPSEAGDPDDGGDQALPFGVDVTGRVEGFDRAMLLASMAGWVVGREGVGRRGRGADCRRPVEQGRLVGFDLGDQGVSRILGGLKGFF